MKEKTSIFVCAYPRSGNTYLSRLLGDVLNSPVTGWGVARPIAEEGMDRPGPYVVRQLHLHPRTGEYSQFIVDMYALAVDLWRGEYLVNILRDPRDILVSAKYYWEVPSLEETILAAKFGRLPFNGVGPMDTFIQEWLEIPLPVCRICYEELVTDTYPVLAKLLSFVHASVSPEAMKASIFRQSFSERKKEIEQNGDRYMYGKEVQLKAMRKGIAGDWHNHFNRKQAEMMETYFGSLLRLTGYEKDEKWVRSI